MSLPDNYSRLDSTGKLLAANKELRATGFTGKLPEFVTRLIGGTRLVQTFNATTVVQVMGLASILATEHPLTVRGAMYRGVGTIFPDTSAQSYQTCARIILKLRRE